MTHFVTIDLTPSAHTPHPLRTQPPPQLTTASRTPLTCLAPHALSDRVVGAVSETVGAWLLITGVMGLHKLTAGDGYTYATSDAPDLATPRTPGPETNVLHPVSLVSVPEELAAAQERLATFLRPLTTQDAFYIGEPEISADSARHITASQLHLCRVFTRMATHSPKTATFESFFTERAEVLETLQPQIRHLVDLSTRETTMRRFWQQGELTAAIARMENRGIDLKLQAHQMLALANATHEVTHNLGRSLRRELLRSHSNLRDGHPRHEDGPVRVARRSRLEATLTDLVNMPAPNSPIAQFSNPLQRAALRQTLDTTPTATRPPSPYPAARSSDTTNFGT